MTFTHHISVTTLPSCGIQVLSAGIEDVTLAMTSEPIVVRIHSEQNLGVLPESDQ